jgi:hypothetical protein
MVSRRGREEWGMSYNYQAHYKPTAQVVVPPRQIKNEYRLNRAVEEYVPLTAEVVSKIIGTPKLRFILDYVRRAEFQTQEPSLTLPKPPSKPDYRGINLPNLKQIPPAPIYSPPPQKDGLIRLLIPPIRRILERGEIRQAQERYQAALKMWELAKAQIETDNAAEQEVYESRKLTSHPHQQYVANLEAYEAEVKRGREELTQAQATHVASWAEFEAQKKADLAVLEQLVANSWNDDGAAEKLILMQLLSSRYPTTLPGKYDVKVSTSESVFEKGLSEAVFT